MQRPVFVVLLIIFVFFTGFFSLSAQEQGLFVKTVPIIKIYSHIEGYKIIYRKSNLRLEEFYVPLSWIVAGGKGEIVYGSSPSYPYFSIFWRDGKFSFIRLYVHESISSLTWGILKATEGVKQKFEIDELDLEF